MNIRQYLDNPMGKGAIIPGKQMIVDDLNKRYKSLTSNKSIECKIYNSKEIYYFHLTIPSESERDNDYDVVIEFSPKDKTDKGDESIINYNIKFFSNCPSFIYTYAYAYNLNGIFIDFMTKKLQKEIFKKPPLVKNPNNIINFEKSLYFACKFLMEEKKYLTKNFIKSASLKFNQKDFLYSIRSHDKIMDEINKAKSKLKQKKEKEEKENKPHKRTKNKMEHSNSPNSVKLIKPKKTTVANNKSGVNKIKKTSAKKSITQSKSGVNKIKKIKKR